MFRADVFILSGICHVGSDLRMSVQQLGSECRPIDYLCFCLFCL